jgi:hypothetical protein
MAACRRALLLLLWGQLLLVLLLAAMLTTPTSATRPLAAISSQAAVYWQPSPAQPDDVAEGHSNSPPAATCDTTRNSRCHQHPSEPAVAAAAAPQQHAGVREEVPDQGARQLLQATAPEGPPALAAPPAQQQDASCLATITYGVTDGRASAGGGRHPGHTHEAVVFGAFTIEPAARPKQVGVTDLIKHNPELEAFMCSRHTTDGQCVGSGFHT